MEIDSSIIWFLQFNFLVLYLHPKLTPERICSFKFTINYFDTFLENDTLIWRLICSTYFDSELLSIKLNLCVLAYIYAD